MLMFKLSIASWKFAEMSANPATTAALKSVTTAVIFVVISVKPATTAALKSTISVCIFAVISVKPTTILSRTVKMLGNLLPRQAFLPTKNFLQQIMTFRIELFRNFQVMPLRIRLISRYNTPGGKFQHPLIRNQFSFSDSTFSII